MEKLQKKSAVGKDPKDAYLTAGIGPGFNSNESSLRKLAHELTERVKELNCLYGISKLVETTDYLEDILQGAVELLPASWQYPDVTCARIKLGKQQFQTANFKKTEWQQVENIIVNGKPFGQVEVHYLEEEPQLDEGPFLKEERHLIHAVAEQLGTVIARKWAEDKLRSLYQREKRLRERLQTEMQSKVDFTRKLVHELKTPLTSLLATSQLLRDETRDRRLAKLAGYVWNSASSLDERVNELHDLVKGELGTLKLKLEPLNLESLLISVREETKALADEASATVNLEVQYPLPQVYGDASRVRQVVLNLLNNAFKYASGSTITIRAIPNKADVSVEVQDQGPGISPSERKRLFQPDHSSASKGKEAGGLGIGLALCKMLVELQGGKIWVKNRPGKGASFFFTLPALETREREFLQSEPGS
ncbi:MAG: GAF domain-containing sensor histidine kinase [Dehalococcoidales bacterium]